MIKAQNPFEFGKVLSPEKFVGRQDEIRDVVSAIESKSCVSITGDRRIGKSSLLKCIVSCFDTQNYWVVQFDFQGFDHLAPADFWNHLVGKFPEKLLNHPLRQQFKKLRENAGNILLLEQFFGACEKLVPIVFVFDEFDLVALNPNFDRTFFDGLRLLSNHITYVIASQQNLFALYLKYKDNEKETLSSPFFNIFHRVPLRGFTQAEIDELVASGLRDTGLSFNESDKELMTYFGGNHPFFLQMTAHFIYASYQNSIDIHSRPQWVQDRVRTNSRDHFHYYWEKMDEQEKSIMAALALIDGEELRKLKVYPARTDPIVQQLLERALLIENSKNLNVFSTLFQDWIIEAFAVIPTARVEEIKAYIDKTHRKGFKKEWIEPIGSSGTSRFDWKNIFSWLIISGGIGNILEWIQTLITIVKK